MYLLLIQIKLNIMRTILSLILGILTISIFCSRGTKSTYDNTYIEYIYYTMPDNIFEVIALEAPSHLVDNKDYFVSEYLLYYRE